MTRFFVDPEGDYIGGYDDGAEPPPDAVEVPAPPPVHAAQKRVGNGWGPPPAPAKGLTADALAARLLAKGVLTAADIEAART